MAQARILTDREFRKTLLYIAAHKHSARNKCMLYCTHLGGLRVGETANLTIKDVLLENGEIKDEVWLSAAKTKGSSGRTFLLPKKLQDEIHDYLCARFKLKDLKVLHFTDTSKALFYSQKNSTRGFSANTLAQWFGNLYRKVGIEGASSHSGRRYFATFMSENTVSPKVIQNLLGHKNLQTTMLYCSVSPKSMRKAVELLS
jgi:integrase/recombinase XerD